MNDVSKITEPVAVPVVEKCPADPNDKYDAFVAVLHKNFARVVKNEAVIFMTDCQEDLWQLYISNIPEDRRQHYNCRTCKKFIETYGKLGIISSSDNSIIPALWSEDVEAVPEIFKASVAACREAVRKSKICSTFWSDEHVWGVPETGEWSHLFVVPPERYILADPIMKASQKIAKKNEEFQTYKRFMETYPLEIITKAYALAQDKRINSPEKIVKHLETALEVKSLWDATKNLKIKDQIIWTIVAKTPIGFGSIFGNVAGAFVKDIDNKLRTEFIISRHNERVKADNYMRPDEGSLNEGNMARAEVIIEAHQLRESLRRKFATLVDVRKHFIWEPKKEEAVEVETKSAGVFDHLKPKLEKKDEVVKPLVDKGNVTWHKFKKDILPEAIGMVFQPDRRLFGIGQRMKYPFSAILTAAVPEAPPIIEWDHPENRNPLSLYTYVNGSLPENWSDESVLKIVGILPVPHVITYTERKPDGVFFIIDKCKDKNYTKSLGLFPFILIPALHEVRSTMEVYSNEGVLEGYEESDANGFYILEGSTLPMVLEVETAVMKYKVTIDRWE